MSRTWPAVRVAWALAGVLVLAGAAAGAYLALRTASEPLSPSQGAKNSDPVRQSAFIFRAHGAPRAMPALAFEDGAGKGRALADFRGKVVLLNVWATWCVPCREEMPALDRLQQKLGGPDFEVLALSIDAGGTAAVKQFYNEIGIRSLAIYVDRTSRTIGTLGLIGIPATLLIDRQGREVGRRTGPAEWDGAEAVRMIEGHLKEAGQ